jgi:hypothetical protein
MYLPKFIQNKILWSTSISQIEQLDDPLPKLCPTVVLSHQDGRHSAVTLLLKAALIQVSDYRLLGASGILLVLLYTVWKRIIQ